MFDIIQTAKEFGVDVQWAISRRTEYLNQKIAELKNEQDMVLQAFSGNNGLNRFLLLDSMRLLNKEIKKCEIELSLKNTGRDSRITQSDINLAKQYPIRNLLLDVRNGKTHCISGIHEDRRPSMDVRNGFVYCYSCGFHGDVIAVYMKLNNVDFVTAVKYLSNIS